MKDIKGFYGRDVFYGKHYEHSINDYKATN